MRARSVLNSLLVVLCLAPVVGCSPGQAQAGRPPGSARVVTYNLQWFSEDANPHRIANVRAVLRKLGPDVVGLQEIQSERALRQVFGKEWQIGMADDPREHQELAIAVREPFTLVSAEFLFAAPQFEEAFPDSRDTLRCVIQTPKGKPLVVYVVHMKSRLGGRLSTDSRRIAACGLLAAFIRSHPEEPNVVVLGDFNDAPDDASVNVLETGDLMAGAGDNKGRRLLVNLCEPLLAKDFATEGVYRLFRGADRTAVVPGSRDDNARLRGQDYDYPDDVLVEQTLFDQILVSSSLATPPVRAFVYAGSEAMRGEPGRTNRSGNDVEYVKKGDLASDHLPVVADIVVR